MGLTVNGLALAVLVFMFVRGQAASRWGLAAVVLAALSLPLLGPVADMARSIGAAVVPLINSVAASAAVG